MLAHVDRKRYEEDKEKWQPVADAETAAKLKKSKLDADAEAEGEAEGDGEGEDESPHSHSHSHSRSQAHLTPHASPLAPAPSRRALSAYSAWAQQERTSMLARNPSRGKSELNQILRNRWKAMPAHEKAVCFALHSAIQLLLWRGEREREKRKEKYILVFLVVILIMSMCTCVLCGSCGRVHVSCLCVCAYVWTCLSVPQLSQDASERDRLHLLEPSVPAPAPAPAPRSLSGDGYGSSLLSAPPAPAFRSRQFHAASAVALWEPEEVGRFIGSLGLTEHRDKFVRSGITGEKFVKLTSPELRDNFLVSNIGDRKKILKSITSLIKLA